MSRDRSRNDSNEKELDAHSLFVHVHCDTSNPPKSRLGAAVRSAFGAGTPASPLGPALRRASAWVRSSSSSTRRRRLRRNSWASSCVPKLNSPSLGSHRTISLGPAADRQQKMRFEGLTATFRDVRRTPIRASSADRSLGMGPSITPSWPFSSFAPRLCSLTRSPMVSWTSFPSSQEGRGSRQVLAMASMSQWKHPPTAPQGLL
mmetsp:Transcript_61192/g.154489  ORF Transcript_61192/g.154489 Transcript_61192/m.154489 type:complete len:204 (-) Transcript_61192:570-1181(-)